MSCSNHEYQSQIEELENKIGELMDKLYERDCEIETLEVENRMMRARNERLEGEVKILQTSVDGLLLIQQTKEKDRLKTIEEVWNNTIDKRG